MKAETARAAGYDCDLSLEGEDGGEVIELDIEFGHGDSGLSCGYQSINLSINQSINLYVSPESVCFDLTSDWV